MLGRRRSYGSVEQTFRFLHRRRNYGYEFIKKDYESLDYDLCESEIYLNSIKNQSFVNVAITLFRRYTNFALVGIIVGLIGSFVILSIKVLASYKNYKLSKFVETCIGGECLTEVYFVWLGWIMIFVFIGSFVIIYIEPGATGGGIAGVVAYLNGVDVPRVLTAQVIFFKVISMICVCVSGIVGGKEGPMIHVGAATGAVIVLLPCIRFLCRPFRSHTEMRDLVAAGVASGVTAAFGAPIGGFLLAVEESVSFLSVSLLFKIFLSALFSCGTVSCILSIYMGKPGFIGHNDLLYMGYISDDDAEYTIHELPVFILMGIIAGFIGSLFVYIQKHFHVFRRTFITRKWLKMLEAMFVAVMTSTTHMLLTYCWMNCKDFDEPGHAVHIDEISLTAVASMLCMYFILTMYTIGISMAIGIFVPNLMLGALWGRCIALLAYKFFPDNSDWANPVKYTFLGAAAQLSGSLRLTFSICVIMIETTGTVHLTIPLMLILSISRWVGNTLTPPMFHAQVVLSGMPLMHADPPAFSSEIPIRVIMARPVVTLTVVISVSEAVTLLKNFKHNGFPVVDNQQTLLGFVLRSQILIMLKYKIFANSDRTLSEMDRIMNREFKSVIKLEDIQLSETDLVQRINFQPMMNPCPYAVRMHMSFERVYYLFRDLGLRHVVVVDSKYQIAGIITRKDLAKYHESFDGISQLPVI